MGAAIDPIRFRSNLYFDGPLAWSELDWVGSELMIGGARLKVVSPTTRCAATTVNSETAQRDLNIPKRLQEAFGHVECGSASSMGLSAVVSRLHHFCTAVGLIP